MTSLEDSGTEITRWVTNPDEQVDASTDRGNSQSKWNPGQEKEASTRKGRQTHQRERDGGRIPTSRWQHAIQATGKQPPSEVVLLHSFEGSGGAVDGEALGQRGGE